MSEMTQAWIPEDTFASRLRALRDALRLTVPEIADQCGVPVPTWRKWEHGSSPRGMERHAKRIAEATGVDLWWLLYGRESSTGYNPTTAVRFDDRPALEVIPGRPQRTGQPSLPLFLSAVKSELAAAAQL